MIEQNLRRTRYLLTVALLLNTIAWFIPDMLFPDSHFQSSTWPLHSRLHAGAAATVNLVYILMGLYMIWRPSFDLRQTMRWVAGGLATWNIVFMAFGLLIFPLIMEPGDIWISWNMTAEGAGNMANIGVEGAVFFMAGVPALLFLLVLWRLRGLPEK
jgi:hypothetical protein